MAVNSFFIPMEVRGKINDVLSLGSKVLYWYPWLSDLRNTDTFVHLSANWGTNGSWPSNPDPGYQYYILSGDSGMPGWAEYVANLYNCPIFLISLPEVYTPSTHKQVSYVPNTYYHKQILKLKESIKLISKKNIKYKASALTSRLTQSKIVIFSALYRQLNTAGVFSLNNTFELKNVHNWQTSGNKEIDELVDYFYNHCLGKNIRLPDDDGNSFSTNNSAFLNSAFNFTQESFHYSYMINGDKECIYPGPFLTEKTFKCLLSKTAFIPVGQYRSYRWLESMGMLFDYNLNLEFDDDPGNLTRLNKLIKLIYDIDKFSAEDLYDMSRSSTEHNYHLIDSGKFFDCCERSNQQSMAAMYNQILG
jgi:hypothetical protein